MKSDDEIVNRTWEKMGAWQDEEPGSAVRARFYQMLEAYEAGRREAAPAARRRWFQWMWLPALAAACLTIGIFAGRGVGGGDISSLRSEVRNMRQLVALSLLQQQSPAERLRGVTWSYRVEPSNTEVLSALLETVNHDENVNVRLAAVEALRKFGSNAEARRGIVSALDQQDSPLMQAALMDLAAELNEREAVPAIQRLAADPKADPSVRQRARAIAASLNKQTF